MLAEQSMTIAAATRGSPPVPAAVLATAPVNDTGLIESSTGRASATASSATAAIRTARSVHSRNRPGSRSRGDAASTNIIAPHSSERYRARPSRWITSGTTAPPSPASMIAFSNISRSRDGSGGAWAVTQEGDKRVVERGRRPEDVKLGRVLPVRVVQRLRVRREAAEVLLADQRRLAEARAFAFEAAQPQQVAEREVDLVWVEHAQRDDLVPAVPQARQRRLDGRREGEEVADDHDERPPPETLGQVMHRARRVRSACRRGALQHVDDARELRVPAMRREPRVDPPVERADADALRLPQ